jgi:hypothetical protein
MHAERTDCPRAVLAIEAERTLMMVLLPGEHEPWSRSELEHEIAGIGGDSRPVADAIRELRGAGLLHVTGELVTPSQAARKMDELSDGAI